MAHPDRVRAAGLAPGYQFGDAAPMFPHPAGDTVTVPMPEHIAAGGEFAQPAPPFPFKSESMVYGMFNPPPAVAAAEHVHDFVSYNATTNRYYCACGDSMSSMKMSARR